MANLASAYSCTGILWLAEAICDNKDIPLAVVTAVGGLACVFITGIIYEEYEL